VQIEVFSDVVCPWCYIGKRRLEEALSTFPHADAVEVTYRSFQLDPSSPATSELTLEEMLAAKYGTSVAQARQMNERVTDLAATVGLDFQLQEARPANTFRAHRLLHFAGTRDLANDLTERLMRAYFAEGVRIGDRDALLALAVSVGLDRDDAAAVLDGDAFTGDVEADISLARAFGVTGVPFFVFDRTYAVAGAQETAVFSEVLETTWRDVHPAADEAGEDLVVGN
jgi:predicted DsbA family dithiol-disulfide isomerase